MNKIILSSNNKPILEIFDFYKLKIHDDYHYQKIRRILTELNEEIEDNRIKKTIGSLFKVPELLLLIDLSLKDIDEDDYKFKFKIEDSTFYVWKSVEDKFILTANESVFNLKIKRLIDDNYDFEFRHKSNTIKNMELTKLFQKRVDILKEIILPKIDFSLTNYFFMINYLHENSNLCGFYVEFDLNRFRNKKLRPIKRYIILPIEPYNTINKKSFIYKDIEFEIINEYDFKNKIYRDANDNFANSYLFLVNATTGIYNINFPHNLIFDFIDYNIILSLYKVGKNCYNYYSNLIKKSILNLALIKTIFSKFLNTNDIDEDNYMYWLDKNINKKKNELKIDLISRNVMKLPHLNLILVEILFSNGFPRYEELNELAKTISLNAFVNCVDIIGELARKYKQI